MKEESILAGIKVGIKHPVRIMGVLNVSPESFFKASVHTQENSIAKMAREMTTQGADIIDVGAMSTAPYLKTQISEVEEARRLQRAVKIIKDSSPLPISIDTSRSQAAEAGLEAGGKILNDVHGLQKDPSLAKIAIHFQGMILMAHPLNTTSNQLKNPLKDTLKLLEGCIQIADDHDIPKSKIVLDPGIGFFRGAKISWWKWDLEILRGLGTLRQLGCPLLIGVSRKSFIGLLLGGKPATERLTGSIAATTIGVLNGASLVRTHDVAATKDAIRIAESIRFSTPSQVTP